MSKAKNLALLLLFGFVLVSNEYSIASDKGVMSARENLLHDYSLLSQQDFDPMAPITQKRAAMVRAVSIESAGIAYVVGVANKDGIITNREYIDLIRFIFRLNKPANGD